MPEAVIINEHLMEALRRLRKNSQDNSVDRRLVTNVLLSFLTTPRADSKRFEMLNLLASVLSWTDAEREKAGLQRTGPTSSSLWGRSSASGSPKGKGAELDKSDETEVRYRCLYSTHEPSIIMGCTSLSPKCGLSSCSKSRRPVLGLHQRRHSRPAELTRRYPVHRRLARQVRRERRGSVRSLPLLWPARLISAGLPRPGRPGREVHHEVSSKTYLCTCYLDFCYIPHL